MRKSISSPLSGLKSPFQQRRAGGGGVAPSVLVSPVITGALAQGSELTFDVGIWSGATSFEIEVTQITPTATLLARQSVAGNTTGTVSSSVGGVLTLNVWATGPGGTTLASSAAFGPIESNLWGPEDEAGLEVWFDFSDTATLTGNPSVTQVTDKSGSGWTLDFATSAPQRTTINSLTAIDFNGSSQSLRRTTKTITNTAKTIAIVFNADALTAGQYLLANQGGGTNDRLYIEPARVIFGSGTAFSFSSVISTTHLIVATSSAVSATSTINAYLDGSAPTGGTSTVGTFAANLGVGANPVPSGRYNGRIAEIIIYNNVLGTTAREKLEGYLANKWASVTLPSGHPYRSSPP